MVISRSRFLTTTLLAALGLTLPAAAQNTGRQAECQKQAADKGLRHGPERRDFMRACVHGKGATPAIPAQPATPAVPGKQDAATTPATPAQPATPAVPARPETASAPAKGFAPPPPDRKAGCAKEADQKALRGPERRDFMRGCMGAP